MTHERAEHCGRPRRPIRSALRAFGVVALLVGAVAVAESPVTATVDPSATATFASWTAVTADSATGTLGAVDVDVAFAGPSGDYPSWGPSITTWDMSDPALYDPAGSATQSSIDYTQRPGTTTFTFDAPVTNLAIYTGAFRGNFGPDAYELNATGTGSWVRVSGNGQLAGSVLRGDIPADGFIDSVIVFSGTLTALEIETVGGLEACCGSQLFTLATLDEVIYPTPSITNVTPPSGPTSGGTILTLTGSGFFEGIDVTVGDGPCTEIEFQSETQLTCVTPTGAPGTVDVTVTTPGGADTLDDAFTYILEPEPNPVVPSFAG